MSRAVDLDEVSFAHRTGGMLALSGVNLTVVEGETVALLGPSGAGKTTLLTLLDGRLRNWRGSVSVLGAPLSPERAPPAPRRANTGFVFQEFALVERSTTRRNVLNGRLGRMAAMPAMLGWAGLDDLAIAERALADCGIADLADRRVDSLSGGQRQRVAIARCLAQEPRLILADEPVSNLDPARAVEILTLLTGAARARKATTLFSSHQPELARRFAERVIGMRDGQIVFDGPSAAFADAATTLYRDAESTASAQLQVVH